MTLPDFPGEWEPCQRVMNGQTDRQTDGRTAKSRTRIADSRQNEISQTDDRPATDLIIGDALNPPGEGAGFADYRLINSTYVSVSVTNIHEFLNLWPEPATPPYFGKQRRLLPGDL